MAIAPDVVEAAMSSYLRVGWRDEQVALGQVECSADVIRGCLSCSDYVMPADGAFHLSALHITIWVQQLAIIYACNRFGVTKAELGEVYLRDLTLRFRRPIRHPDNIAIELRPRSRRTVGALFFCAGSVDVGAGAITGHLAAVAPVPGQRTG